VPDTLILTFAELEFAFRALGDRAATVRDRLNINPEAASEIVVASGIASLLARGMATADATDATDVTPGEPLLSVATGLATHDTYAHLAGWVGDTPANLHVFSGPLIRLSLSAGAFGQFAVGLNDPAEPLATVVDRFIDVCAAAGAEVAVAIRFFAGPDAVDAGVARDAAGVWRVSDTRHDAGGSETISREGLHARLEELFGQPVATN
jgi:hypothetical protein